MSIVFEEIVAQIEPEAPARQEAAAPPPRREPESRPDALRAELDVLARRAARLVAD